MLLDFRVFSAIRKMRSVRLLSIFLLAASIQIAAAEGEKDGLPESSAKTRSVAPDAREGEASHTDAPSASVPARAADAQGERKRSPTPKRASPRISRRLKAQKEARRRIAINRCALLVFRFLVS